MTLIFLLSGHCWALYQIVNSILFNAADGPWCYASSWCVWAWWVCIKLSQHYLTLGRGSKMPKFLFFSTIKCMKNQTVVSGILARIHCGIKKWPDWNKEETLCEYLNFAKLLQFMFDILIWKKESFWILFFTFKNGFILIKLNINLPDMRTLMITFWSCQNWEHPWKTDWIFFYKKNRLKNSLWKNRSPPKLNVGFRKKAEILLKS